MDILKRLNFLIVPLLFFIISLFTIYDYGMNWDSPIHFARGQAFLRYILTGKTSYDTTPSYCKDAYAINSRLDYNTGEICDRHRKIRVSEYESNLLDFNWAKNDVYGHPPFSDIMMAVSNNIFFKQLGWFEDINAYHLYSLLTTFLLALIVSIWTKQTFGTFASIIAVISVYTFPLLFAEQHFNIKDPPMAAFFTISLYFFWLALVKKRAKYLLFSALAGGASIGTKLNFLFAPFILLPFLITYITTQIKPVISKKNYKFTIPKITLLVLNIFPKSMLLAFILYPLIIFLVFFISWPALWENPIKNITQVITFYQDIGGGQTCPYSTLTPLWFGNCLDFTTLQYLIYTLPPISIFLFLIGLIYSLLRVKEKNYVTLLWVTFFAFTILRVTLPISSIYGGLRQIMEFIAPFSMITALGALFLRNFLLKRFLLLFSIKKTNKSYNFLASLIIIALFIPIFITLKQIHPNQNVYFNSFTGGLNGAAEKNFPGYGNSYGNVYLQAVRWLNQNAEPGATVALIDGHGQNISRAWFREDIQFFVSSLSGYKQLGEYMILIINKEDPFRDSFRQKYAHTFLDPVYDIQVDGVSLLKIWKNDKRYLKKGINLQDETKENPNIIIDDKKMLTLNLTDKKELKRLEISFPTVECKNSLVGAQVHIYTDVNKKIKQRDEINDFTETEIARYGSDFVYFFAGEEAQFINITPPNNYPCNLSDIKFSLYSFLNLYPQEKKNYEK